MKAIRAAGVIAVVLSMVSLSVSAQERRLVTCKDSEGTVRQYDSSVTCPAGTDDVSNTYPYNADPETLRREAEYKASLTTERTAQAAARRAETGEDEKIRIADQNRQMQRDGTTALAFGFIVGLIAKLVFKRSFILWFLVAAFLRAALATWVAMQSGG